MDSNSEKKKFKQIKVDRSWEISFSPIMGQATGMDHQDHFRIECTLYFLTQKLLFVNTP